MAILAEQDRQQADDAAAPAQTMYNEKIELRGQADIEVVS